MCGIAGFAGFDDPSLLHAMAASLVHRGPDAAGFFTAPGVGLASRRLSVIDLSTGNQPIANEDGTLHVVFNGELYNCDALRAALTARGHRFSTTSDTECIVHLYEERGLDFLRELRGMFAIALWDGPRRRLVLARDRIGEKPLYYAVDGARLLFGSEPKAILQAARAREADAQAVCDYLAMGYVPAPRSFFRGVSKLAPAQMLVYEDGRATLTRYWQRSAAKSNQPYEAAERELADRLEETVRTCLRSDVEVGAFLSGGIDSSMMVALMRPHATRLQTFAVGYRGAAAGFNELEYARRVARAFDTDHHELILGAGAQLELLPAVAWHYDEPNGEPTSALVYQLSQFTSRHVKVAVSGTGGDEIFAGYPRYRAVGLRERYLRLPRAVRAHVIERLVATWPESTRGGRFARRARRFVVSAGGPADAAYLSWVSLLQRDRRAGLLGATTAAQAADPAGDRVLLEYLSGAGGRELLDRATALDVEQYLPEYQLTYVDRMSMAHGLEVRAPLSDYQLVDYVTALPIDYRLHRGHSKHIFKRVSRRWIDPAIAERRKVGFDSPVGQWFKEDLRPFLTSFLAPEQVARTGLLDPEGVQRLVGEHLSGQRDYSLPLWSILSLETWHRMYIEDRITDGRSYRLSDLRGVPACSRASAATAPATPATERAPAAPTPAPAPLPPPAAPRSPFHVAVRVALRMYLTALRAAKAIRRRPRSEDDGCDVLLTGAFQSSSWMEHHLTPMAASTACRSITIVTAGDVPPLPKVTTVRPPAWLSAIAGETAARLAMFAALGLRRRPHVVGGFHLLFNGLLAGLVAPLAGSRSMYFCVGGPAEMLDGGLLAENRLFNRLRAPDPAIERLLVRAATAFDVVVTMGSRAATFLTDRGATGTVHVIPGGLDDTRYRPSTAPPETDVMFVGRLEPIKRPELLLDALAVVATRNPNLRATLVGDGQLRSALERKARDLGIDRLVTFAGRCADVHDRLPRARVFVLTSRSEGVALSLMEALACGVPAVAPRVGDLEDVLVDGVNGFLIDDHTPEAFAARISSLLEDEALRSRLGVAARTMAGGYELRAVAHRWDAALRGEPAGAGYSAGASACSMRATMAGSSR